MAGSCGLDTYIVLFRRLSHQVVFSNYCSRGDEDDSTLLYHLLHISKDSKNVNAFVF